jgi:hypothetical protein
VNIKIYGKKPQNIGNYEKHWKKKLVRGRSLAAFLCCVFLTAGFLTGCGGTAESSSATSESPAGSDISDNAANTADSSASVDSAASSASADSAGLTIQASAADTSAAASGT